MRPIRLAALALCAALALPVVAQETLKVACIGDSITFGFGLADRANESYPAQLQKLLDGKFPGRFEVRNFGNSGRGIYLDSMRGSEKRGFRHMPEHKAALEWQPDIVICNLGINDNGEYIKEFTGGRRRGQFIDDYIALLGDYTSRKKTRVYIWTKLSPLTEGQRFYRSPEPFLMQADLEEVARLTGAHGIDMQEPLREGMDAIFAKDHIHPDASGAKIIAETTFNALARDIEEKGRPARGRVEIPEDVRGRCEVWLCAGQSNMQKGWGEFNWSPAEKARVQSEMARLVDLDIRFWDFNDGLWTKLTPQNALRKSATGVSFAIRRAEASGMPVCMLYVAAGGAPTEAFLSESTMCAVGKDGKSVYPALSAIATNRHRLDKNRDFPCAWVAREYPRRRNNMDEGHWWPVSIMYDNGIKLIRDIPLTGIFWYQGESNATTCVAPDKPTPGDYQMETLRAVIDELRGGKDVPFVMMGLPKMNRPWEPYREAQKKVCAEKGAEFVDTFARGLGEMNDAHPRDKVAFADLAAEAAKRALDGQPSGGGRR